MTHDLKGAPVASTNSFDAHGTLEVGRAVLRDLPARRGRGQRDAAVQPQGAAGEPAAHRGRRQHHRRPHPRARRRGTPTAEPDTEIQFTPARVIMQDFTGVPCVVDLATMREAVADLGGDPTQDQPARPGRAGHRPLGHRRRLRHAPTPSSATSSSSTSATASATSSCAGARPRSTTSRSSRRAPASCTRSTSSTWPASSWSATASAYPDTCVGTDSHTTMVNGLGVLGWGVGGIEAEAAMLGQPVSMLIPRVVGFKLTGAIPAGVDRHRPRAHDHRDAAQARRRRQVRRVLRRGRRRGAAGQPRHHRQHEPRVRLDRARSSRSTT